MREPEQRAHARRGEKSAKKKKRKGPHLQHRENNETTAEADQRQKKSSNTNGEQQQQHHARRDTNFRRNLGPSDTSLPFALMNALNNNNDDNTNKNEKEVDEEKERRDFLFSGGGGGGGGGSLASRLLKSGGNRDNTTKLAGGGGVGNIRGGALGNANVVDKAMLAKQKLVKRARAELPPEDFPKFVEVMKSVVSADSSDVALHESMKTLAKLCKIEKRGVGPSTLWAAIGTSLALKDAAKKAYRRVRGERETENGRKQRRRRRRQQQRFHRSYNHRNLLLLQNRKSTPASKISSDASRDRQKKIPFRENSNRVSPPNLPPHLKLRKKQQKRKPLATIAKPPSATGLSNRSSAATLPVTSASTPSSRKAAQKPRKRQTTIKTTR